MIGSGGLDRIVESNRETKNVPPDFDEEKRRFLKVLIFLGAEILCGIGFAGCSSKRPRGSNIEFKPQNPLQSGYKLIYPENSEPVPSYSTLQPVIQIGKERGFEVYAPGDIDCYIKGRKEDIPIRDVKPGMIIICFSSNSSRHWIIGDIYKYYDDKIGANAFDFTYVEEISSDVYFVKENMGDPGALFVIGALGNKAYASLTFIEEGHGKVASFYYEQDRKNPKNYERYAFHSNQKDLLNKMWIEITSAQRISEIPNDVGGGKFGVKPEEWYKIPDEASKKWLPG